MSLNCGSNVSGHLDIVMKLTKLFLKKKFLKSDVKRPNELKVLVLLAKVWTFYENVKCLKCPILKKVNKDVNLIARTRVKGFSGTCFVSFGTI